MESRPQIFACVGPESTGKTTLCNQLASHSGGSMVPEFAREYITAKGGNYVESDLITIAENQLKLENNIISQSTGPFFCDTDILVIMVWHQFKYGRRNKEIEQLFELQKPRKYLLTYPDIEWEPDPLRENPNDLQQIFQLYEFSLKSINADYKIIRGIGDQRLSNAVEAVSSFFAQSRKEK